MLRVLKYVLLFETKISIVIINIVIFHTNICSDRGSNPEPQASQSGSLTTGLCGHQLIRAVPQASKAYQTESSANSITSDHFFPLSLSQLTVLFLQIVTTLTQCSTSDGRDFAFRNKLEQITSLANTEVIDHCTGILSVTASVIYISFRFFFIV